MTTERINRNLDRSCENFFKFCKTQLGQDYIITKQHVVGGGWGVDISGVIIHTEDYKEYTVEYPKYIPASYWEPESIDCWWVDSKHDNVSSALFAVLNIHLSNYYESYLECELEPVDEEGYE